MNSVVILSPVDREGRTNMMVYTNSLSIVAETARYLRTETNFSPGSLNVMRCGATRAKTALPLPEPRAREVRSPQRLPSGASHQRDVEARDSPPSMSSFRSPIDGHRKTTAQGQLDYLRCYLLPPVPANI